MKYHCRLRRFMCERDRRSRLLFTYTLVGSSSRGLGIGSYSCLDTPLQDYLSHMCTTGFTYTLDAWRCERSIERRKKKTRNSDKMERNELIWSLMAIKKGQENVDIAFISIGTTFLARLNNLAESRIRNHTGWYQKKSPPSIELTDKVDRRKSPCWSLFPRCLRIT